MYSATKMRIKNIETIANSDTILLTNVRPLYEYEAGQRTDKQLGYTYEAVMLDAGYEKITIKVLGVKQQFKQEDLNEANGILVRPLDFEAGFYNARSGGSFLTARASSFEVVKP